MSLDLISGTSSSPKPNSTPQNIFETGFTSSNFGRFDPQIRRFLESSITASTRRAYAGDLGHFINWGGSIPASPETLARYLADHASTWSVATLSRRLAAIGRAHVLEGLTNPASTDLVRMVRRGIRRIYGRPQERVAALTAKQLVAITSSLGTSTRDIRDRALLLIGFAGAFRRSEDTKTAHIRTLNALIFQTGTPTRNQLVCKEPAIPATRYELDLSPVP